MNKITPLITSLHEGHKAEERLKCIDDMLVICEDTKFTVLQAFWWYRKYTKAKLQKLERIEQIVERFKSQYDHTSNLDLLVEIKEVLEQE